MAERMVQVPVSLIERAEAAKSDADAWRVVGDLLLCAPETAAALSQPGPSDKPMRAAQSDDGDRLIEFAERILGVPLDPWQKRLCRRVFGGNVGRSTGRPDATPPRIEDMAPGTTFVQAVTWAVAASGSGKKYAHRQVGKFGSQLITDHDIDPPTIRDVTPPKEQP